MIKLYGRIQPKRLFGEVKINHGAFNGKLQAKTVAPSQEEQTVFPDSGFKGLSHVIVEAATLQEKTITPSGIEQTVIPDVGTYGLSKVIVKAQGNHGLLEEKTVSPSEEEQILTPGDGYYGIQSVTVKAAPLEEKTATSTDQDQTLTPSEGFYGMDRVVVKGIPNAEDYTFCEIETFPTIPADVIAANPYALIVETSISGATAYVLNVSTSAFFYGKEGGERGLGTAGSGTMYYVNVGGTAWSKVQDFTAGNGVAALSESDALMWANHDLTDVNEGFIYFAKSDVKPAASAEVYRIQKETADDIGYEINRLWKTAEPMTAERMREKLANLDIELTELTVYPTDEVQEITPDGYYGFSKVIVEAVEDSGGSGGSGDEEDTYPEADNTTFGDEYTEEEVETGLLDYSSGTDENAIGLPAIPDGDYQILLRKANVGMHFAYYYRNEFREVETDVPASIFATTAHHAMDNDWLGCMTGVHLHSEKIGQSRTRTNGGDWNSWRELDGTKALITVGTGHYSHEECQLHDAITGIPKYDLGTWSDDQAYRDAFLAVIPKARAERGSDFIALVSSSQIIFDGTNARNVDGSPMTIYECTSADRSTWKEIGQTDGDYIVDGYDLTWNSHDLLDSSGENVTYEASDAPVPETKTTTVVTPTDRNDIYTINGNSVNSMVSAAQKITGTQKTMTPDEAAKILDNYYSSPTAEEGVY